MSNVNRDVQEYTRCFNKVVKFAAPREVPRINMLLFGGVGAGKSSLVSSVDSLFKGRMSRRAAHGQGTGSFTRTLTKFSFKVELQGEDGKTLTFQWDIRRKSAHDY